MLGTEWTATGEGSTRWQLLVGFGPFTHRTPQWRAMEKLLGHAPELDSPILKQSTNLRLTGAPITKTDWERLELEQFKVGE